MKKFCNILCFMIVFVNLFLILTVSDAKAEGAEDFEYYISDGYAYIVGYSGDSQEVIIPAALDNHPVVSVVDFGQNNVVKKIVIENGVDNIDSLAFSSCFSLEEISIPNTVRCIYFGAFSGCNLQQVYIPESVAYIGEEAFSECYQLRLVQLQSGKTYIENGAFRYSDVCYIDIYDDFDEFDRSTISDHTLIGKHNFTYKCYTNKIVRDIIVYFYRQPTILVVFILFIVLLVTIIPIVVPTALIIYKGSIRKYKKYSLNYINYISLTERENANIVCRKIKRKFSLKEILIYLTIAFFSIFLFLYFTALIENKLLKIFSGRAKILAVIIVALFVFACIFLLIFLFFKIRKFIIDKFEILQVPRPVLIKKWRINRDK